MKFSTSVCDICGRHRRSGNHESCSRVRQALGTLDAKPRPARKRFTAHNEAYVVALARQD